MTVPMFESEHSPSVLSELRRMAPGKRVRTTSALRKLEEKLGLPRVSIDEAVRDLHRARLLLYKADGRGLPASGYINVVHDVVAPSHHDMAWAQSLEDAGFDAAQRSVLSGLASQLADFPMHDMQHLAGCLKHLSALDAQALDDAGFNISAMHIMGSSKVLSLLTKRMLDALKLSPTLHQASPKYVLCAGPRVPKATLLIENPRAFENAVRSGLSNEVVLICTFGFGLSYLGNAQLYSDDAAEHERPVMIVREGTPPPLSTSLRASDVFLWADLDVAAIGIYRALKAAIPQLRWSGIYEAMLPMLREPRLSHPYAALFEKDGQHVLFQRGEPISPLDPETTLLWKSCQHRALDQEAVDDVTIKRLGATPFRDTSC